MHSVEHYGETPSYEAYGWQASVTAPVFVRYLQAILNQPPLQPISTESQATKSYGERTTSVPEAMQILSDKTSVAEKAQHEPQPP